MLRPSAHVLLAAAIVALTVAPVALCAGERPRPNQAGAETARCCVVAHNSSAQLVRGVLVATGHDAASADRWNRVFDQFVDRLRSRQTVRGNTRQRVRAIHDFMHGEILLGKYDAGASDLASALAGGPFNCASASALLIALASQFDLEVRAVSVVGHVWCRVDPVGQPFDVETTCRDWFLLAQRRQRDPSAEHNSAWQDHLHRKAVARELDEAGFLAIFHYNRGVRMLREGRFEAAAAANLAALRLDWRCEPAYGNLAAALLRGASAAAGSAEPSISAAVAR